MRGVTEQQAKAKLQEAVGQSESWGGNQPLRPTSVPVPDNGSDSAIDRGGELRRSISSQSHLLQSYVPEQQLDLNNEIKEEYDNAVNHTVGKHQKEELCVMEDHCSAEENHSKRLDSSSLDANEMILDELVAIKKSHNVSFNIVFWSVI